VFLVIEACQLSHLFLLSWHAQSPFHEFFLPLLRRSADGRERTLAALRGPIGDDFGLIEAERAELLPCGTQTRFVSRFCSAKIHRSPPSDTRVRTAP